MAQDTTMVPLATYKALAAKYEAIATKYTKAQGIIAKLTEGGIACGWVAEAVCYRGSATLQTCVLRSS